MSVLTVDSSVINYIRAGIETASYRTEITDEYYYVIVEHMRGKNYAGITAECLRLARSWACMNDKCYAERYNEPFTDFSEEIQTGPPFKPVTPVQLFKYVQCVLYNIEEEYLNMTEQEVKDLELLRKLEVCILTAIVAYTKEYQDAKWC